VPGVAYDSRRVRKGDAFFALAGARDDGAGYARAALQAGAVAVIGASPGAIDGATTIAVSEPRLALAHAAARWYGDPSLALRVVAVTGTNGKTTTTYLLESVFRAAGWTPGVIGTTGIHVGDEQRHSPTTPGSAGAAGAARRDARARVSRGRAGDEQPCARPAAAATDCTRTWRCSRT
jgi:UDP-N-acetylmuramoyl-L-alanyl-D-glutamate--2,6-diaminopimelate ligase